LTKLTVSVNETNIINCNRCLTNGTKTLRWS